MNIGFLFRDLTVLMYFFKYTHIFIYFIYNILYLYCDNTTNKEYVCTRTNINTLITFS